MDRAPREHPSDRSGGPDTVAQPTEPTEPTDPAEPALRRLAGWGRVRAEEAQERAKTTLDDNRGHWPVDVAVRIYVRDQEDAGTLVGSAIAFRLFLFFVPLLLFVVGLTGFLTSFVEQDDVASAGV